MEKELRQATAATLPNVFLKFKLKLASAYESFFLNLPCAFSLIENCKLVGDHVKVLENLFFYVKKENNEWNWRQPALPERIWSWKLGTQSWKRTLWTVQEAIHLPSWLLHHFKETLLQGTHNCKLLVRTVQFTFNKTGGRNQQWTAQRTDCHERSLWICSTNLPRHNPLCWSRELPGSNLLIFHVRTNIINFLPNLLFLLLLLLFYYFILLL